MNDLETRLRALRPLPAPRAIFDRARRGRRPWLPALAAAAALAVTAFVVVSAPLPRRPDPASDYRSMVDRLLRAETLDLEIHTKGSVPMPSGEVRKVERETVLRVKKGGRIHGVLLERQPGIPASETRIEIVSDGTRLRDRRWALGKAIWDKERAAPEDLHRRIVHWLMSTGDVNPVQIVLDVPLADLPAEIKPVEPPGDQPPGSRAWTTMAAGLRTTLIYDPKSGLLTGRVVDLAGGEFTEVIREFHVDEPLDDRLFVLPK